MPTFSTLLPLLATGPLSLTIAKEGDNLRVCVLPSQIAAQTKGHSDAPNVTFPPMSFVASAADLDAGFCAAVQAGIVAPATSLLAQAERLRSEYDVAAKAADEANKAAIKAKQAKAKPAVSAVPAIAVAPKPAPVPQLDLFGSPTPVVAAPEAPAAAPAPAAEAADDEDDAAE